MVKILAALSILNSSGATEKVAELVARATCRGARHRSVNTPGILHPIDGTDRGFCESHLQLSEVFHRVQIYESIVTQVQSCQLTLQKVALYVSTV